VKINLEADDLQVPISPDTSLGFFCMFQEALGNAAKHSGTKQSSVRLWGTSTEVHLMVSDSGSGFNTEVAKVGRGLGLISMHERLKILNGTSSIESQPEQGTTIHASVPINPATPSVPTA
jgi:signal transduction histidine kinase